MIDVSNPNTFPSELSNLVLAQLGLIPPKDLQSIKNTSVKNNNDVLCAIEKNLGPGSAYSLYHNELIPMFCQHELLCYHATRVGTPEDIRIQGLFSDMEKYKQHLIGFLRNENVNEDTINITIDLICHEYSRKYSGKPHNICFFTNYKSLYDKDGYAAYDQFYETVGGELASWALESKLPEILNVLRTKGIPVVVKFKIPFSRIACYDQEGLIYQFVSAVAAKNLWDFNYMVEADSSLTGDVPPTDIISIIPIEEKKKV